MQPPFWIRHSELIFPLKTFAAAALALVAALYLDMARPYWAFATVYIVSHPIAGATISKAFYRILGTAVGAVVAVLSVTNLTKSPELLSLFMAAWVGLCVYLSLIRPHAPQLYVPACRLRRRHHRYPLHLDANSGLGHGRGTGSRDLARHRLRDRGFHACLSREHQICAGLPHREVAGPSPPSWA